MCAAYIFLYEATAQYFGDTHAQLERRGKILEIIWHISQTST
jgi:hypothetical protein